MRSLAWVFAGVLGLVALDAVIGSSSGAERFTGLLGAVSNGLNRFLDPTISAIPNITGTPTSSPT